MTNRNARRRNAKICELAELLAIGAAIRLRVNSDDVRAVVDAVVATLVEEYPSQYLYVPASVSYPVGQIRDDVKAGMSMRSICTKHRLDRRTIYRLLDQPE